MAFPTVQATNDSITSPGATTATVSLPASISSGDLLIILLATTADLTWTTPSGWTSLFNYAPSASRKMVGYYRVADGGEGATVSVSLSTSATTWHNAYRITGYTSPPESGAGATGASGQPDPPSLTASGSGDNLWIAIAWGVDVTPTATAPTNYGNKIERAGSNLTLASARRENTTGTENPGAFADFTSAEWAAQTIVVLPAAAGGQPISKRHGGVPFMALPGRGNMW